MSRLLVCAWVVLFWCALPVEARQTQGPWPLTSVRVEGASRYAAEDIVRISGLVQGESISLDRLQGLANDMAATGLFRRVGVAYSSAPEGGLVVTLRIEEPEWSVPLVYDNLIGVTDAEFTQAMARHIPAFDGTAVKGGTANDFIVATAERVLAERGIDATVIIIPKLSETRETTFALVARRPGHDMRVCEVRYPGASSLPSRLVDALATEHVGRDYSRSALNGIVAALRDSYRERGYWRAAIAAPAPSQEEGCPGITVDVRVEEGAPYTFAGARWIGTSAVPLDELNRALPLRAGAVADQRRLKDGLTAVERRYHEAGYLTVASGVRAEFDDAEHTVVFAIELQEGPQFRMGQLTTEGLSERQTSDITRRWRLQPGEIFNGRYYLDFLRDQSERLGGGLRGRANLDRDTATVNVIFAMDGP
jgi:outer membrane protein assembly factor BamA